MKIKKMLFIIILSFAMTEFAWANDFGKSFWKTWGDGRAELAGYDLIFPRYGEKRKGKAVLIFVTEPFSKSLRVKADPDRRSTDVVQVMKLNLVRDFPTGLYDYNLMTSVFTALEPAGARPAGSALKVSFSSQEWCGQVYHHVLFRDNHADETIHSYFDRESDQTRKLNYPERGLSEDALFHWARGFAAPFLKPGEEKTVPLFTSLLTARLKHVSTEWKTVSLKRGEQTQTIRVPGGLFKVVVHEAGIESGPAWRFFVEADKPHRLIKWTNTNGETGFFLNSACLPYWKMNGIKHESAVNELGLKRI